MWWVCYWWWFNSGISRFIYWIINGVGFVSIRSFIGLLDWAFNFPRFSFSKATIFFNLTLLTTITFVSSFRLYLLGFISEGGCHLMLPFISISVFFFLISIFRLTFGDWLVWACLIIVMFSFLLVIGLNQCFLGCSFSFISSIMWFHFSFSY